MSEIGCEHEIWIGNMCGLCHLTRPGAAVDIAADVEDSPNIYRWIGLPFRLILGLFILPIALFGECVLPGAEGFVKIAWNYIWMFE